MTTSQPSMPDMSALTGELYRQWEKAMSSWWEGVVENPGFLKGMSENLANMSAARSRYEESVDESMERLHLPTRKDLVRLARVNNLLEERLLAQEDVILALQDKLVALEREVVSARVEAAEARLESREILATILDKLDGLASPAPAESPVTQAPAAPRGRRGSGT